MGVVAACIEDETCSTGLLSLLGAGGGRSAGLSTREVGVEPEGPFTSFRRDPSTGKITHYEEFQPQSNPRNPNKWESVKRVDATGKGHFNKATQQKVETPHVHDPKAPGGVRPARPDEIPPT